MSNLIEVDDSTFAAEVLQSPVPVLVDLWASHCQPCLMLKPVLAALAESLGDKVKIVTVDVATNERLVILQHMVNNDDYSFSQMIEYLHLAGMSNKKLVELLEQAVHPLVRVDAEQTVFVTEFNTHLKSDGLALVASDDVSGFPVYRVFPIDNGVTGTAKNLIFASNGPKPEIVLSDAINNDIKIVKHEEHCLVYDRPILKHGLLWKDVISWWCDKHGLSESDDTERELYRRLAKSLSFEPEKLFLEPILSRFGRHFETGFQP